MTLYFSLISPFIYISIIQTKIQKNSNMKIIKHHPLTLLTIILTLLIKQNHALSGSTVASLCHCDLTPSFCDFNCCCDTQCSSTITTQCSNRHSFSYCPNPTYFSRIGSTYQTSTGCFYYNTTDTILEEITISTNQVNTILKNNTPFTPIAKSSNLYKGYLLNDVLSFSNTTNFNVIDTNGNCLQNAGTNSQFSIKFGMNLRISCLCPSCTTLPSIFTAFLSKTISQYSNDLTKTITTPSIPDQSMTNLQVNIIVNTYGSQQLQYIERITYSYLSQSNTSERNLQIVFVMPSQIVSNQSSVSFFPQIPQDIFYPIYVVS